MDDMEDDAKYSSKPYAFNPYNPSNRRRIPIRDAPFTRPITYRYEEKDEDELEELDEELHQEDHEVEEEDEERNGYDRNFDEDEYFERHPKKRKLKNLASRYEFAPRVKSSFGDRSPMFESDWSEHSMFVLLEVWGDRFLQLGRKSLRSEDWVEVAEKVSEVSRIEKTETQCRNMMDLLKRKYKKEKMKMEEMGLKSSKWGYFQKMDMLMASLPRQKYGLACGVDSGEFVFMNTRVYLDRSNRFDEMRDSPVESESSEDESENWRNFSGIPSRRGGGNGDDGSSFRVLADSVQKFGKIYEKIESSKRQQMMELENMRMEFYKELEMQKKQILEKTQAEIAKIQEEDDEDTSVEDLSE
ncbi:hypothetical protein UlMin_022286 [Ulmus minor]